MPWSIVKAADADRRPLRRDPGSRRGGLVLDEIRRHFPSLELSGLTAVTTPGRFDAAEAKVPWLRLEIVKRNDTMKGFLVLPRRGIVERTFSWTGRNRRLAKDFENFAETLAVTFKRQRVGGRRSQGSLGDAIRSQAVTSTVKSPKHSQTYGWGLCNAP